MLASAGMATVVITASAIVLVWATGIDWAYGLDVARFAVYDTSWFAWLLALVGVNVLAAAVVRFPWRRRHVGFLLVHAGILVLLVGCWQTARDGVDATLAVFEGDRSSTALTDQKEITLTITHDQDPKADGTSAAKHQRAVQTETISFRPGSLNWAEYSTRSWFPWRLAHRDQGVLWDHDGVKLEVLDYCSDAEQILVPWVELRLARGRSVRKRDAAAWTPVRLAVRELPDGVSPDRALYLGSRAEWDDGLGVVFRAASSAAETAAFRQSRPKGPLGQLGQVVLFARGKTYPVLVDALRKKPVPLGDSGLSVELGSFDPDHLLVQLLVRDAGAKKKPPGRLILGAVRTDFDLQDARHGVCGSYYFDGSLTADQVSADGVPPAALAEAARPRIDVLQGHDEKLYYRVWRSGTVETLDELPRNGRPVTVLEKSGEPVVFYVAQFTPAAKPGVEIRPRPFRKDRRRDERARLRLTVDGRSKEFWLAPRVADVPARQRIGHLTAGRRTVAVALDHQVVPLGFEVELVDFQRKLDPGTPRPSSYSSRANIFNADSREPIARDVVIELNRPYGVVDPTTGRTYRLFQSSFEGPFTPGDGPFDALVGGRRKADELYRSVFTVAFDPGRPWKYAGCLMIVAGIVVMYYMKAYFFERRAKDRSKGEGIG